MKPAQMNSKMKNNDIELRTKKPQAGHSFWLHAGLIVALTALPGCALVKKLGDERSEAAQSSATKPLAGPKAPAAQAVGPNSAPPNAANAEGAVRKDSLLHLGTGNFVKQAPPSPQTAPGPEEFTLNFEATDIRAIIQSIMGDYLRESFTIHPQTQGSATIRLSRPVPRKDLIPILEMLLRQNNQVMVREEGMYKVMPAALGMRGTIAPQLAQGQAQLPTGYSVQIVQLKYAGAADMQRILLPYASDPMVSVQIDPVRNLIILSGTQRELKHLFDIIELFDVDFLAGYSVGLFQMSTDVKALSADLDKIFGDATKSPLAGIVRIIPIERMNGLLVVSTQPRYLEEAKKWIERLDKSGGVSGGMRLNVYAVQHGKAEKLAQLLSEIYGNKQGGSSGPTLAPGQRPATISTPITGAPGSPPTPQTPAQAALQSLISFAGSGVSVSKDVRIIADNDNNSLLILASPSDYETIQTALRQLDVPRRQVSVEVLVAEVTLSDELSFGVEAFINSRRDDLSGALRGLGAMPNLPGLGGKDPLELVKPATNGLQLINAVGGNIRGVIQALGTDGRAQVVSTPRVMVLDNEKASINVGTQISVDTGTSTGGTAVNTVTTRQYISTGVILSVTPRINSGGRVTLDVTQEVSSAGAAATGTNPPINQRKAQTVVTVGSGETMVLAGMIQKDTGSGSSGIPLLSKIPLLGSLFGSQNYRNNRTELVILITPTVVSNSDEVKAVTDEIRSKLPVLEHLIPKSK